jgi:hypothetical protein
MAGSKEWRASHPYGVDLLAGNTRKTIFLGVYTREKIVFRV